MKQVIANFPDMAALLAEGKIKRQYRDHRLEWMIRGGGMSVVQEGVEKSTSAAACPIELLRRVLHDCSL
jgi:hypothetical protein